MKVKRRNLYLEREFGKPGWGLPSILFGILIFTFAIYKSFNGTPFALISGIGTLIEWSAVSTVIYAPEFKKSLLKKIIYAFPVWMFGAFLVHIGGMKGLLCTTQCPPSRALFLICYPLFLYIFPTLLGTTFYPINHEAEDLIKSRLSVTKAAKALADKVMSQYPQPPDFRFATEFATDIKRGGIIPTKIKNCPGVSVELGSYVEVYGELNCLDEQTQKSLASLGSKMGFKREESASFLIMLWEFVKIRMQEKGVQVNDTTTVEMIVHQIINTKK